MDRIGRDHGRTLGVILALVIAFWTPGDARAQSAAAEQVYQFDIGPGPLVTVLQEIALSSNITLSYDAGLLAGQSSPGISGTYSAEEAISQLLLGTGIRSEVLGPSTIALQEEQGLPGNDSDLEGIFTADEIIVQGELLNRSLQETLTSVAVITGEEVEGRSDVDLGQVIERTPGVTNSSGGFDVAVRGVTQSGLGGAGTGDLVSVTVDGSRFGEVNRIFNANYSTWDLEQIEVLRGPQSTQTGRNALAGAIDIRSKDPSFDTEIKLRGGLGNAETFQTAAAFNLPIIEDTLALRFSADLTHTSGFITNPVIGITDQDEDQRLTLRGALRFEPTDDFSAVVKLTHIDQEFGFGELELASFPDRRVFGTDIQDRVKVGLEAINLRMTYDLSDTLWIESETNYFESDVDQLIDPDDGPFPLPRTIAGSNSESVEQELRLHYENDKVTGVIGAFFTDVDAEDIIKASGPASLLNAALPATATVFLDNFVSNEIQNIAFFGEVEYDVISDLKLIAGARYDREEVTTVRESVTTSNDPTVSPFLPTATSETISTEFDAFLPKLGAVYSFTDDVRLGFTVQRGYRAGGAAANLFRGTPFEFDPEFTWNYELAFRSQWFEDRLTVNANAFYTDWTDQQVSVTLSANPLDFEVRNAGRSRVLGGELELRGNPIDELELFASFAYSDTKFTDFKFNDFNGVEIDVSGREFPFASKLNIAFGGEYTFDNGFYFSADANYQDGSFEDILNTPTLETDGRFLVNARVGYEAENWSIFAYATNLFDEDHLTRIRTGARLGVAGEPRRFGLVGQINF